MVRTNNSSAKDTQPPYMETKAPTINMHVISDQLSQIREEFLKREIEMNEELEKIGRMGIRNNIPLAPLTCLMISMTFQKTCLLKRLLSKVVLTLHSPFLAMSKTLLRDNIHGSISPHWICIDLKVLT